MKRIKRQLAVAVTGLVVSLVINAPTWAAIDVVSFLRAVSSGKAEMVKEQLSQGEDIEAKGKNGGTALILAIQNHHLDIARLLINKGANVNAKDKFGWSVLMFAAANGSSDGKTDIVPYLINKGADVNAKNTNDETALMLAITFGQTGIARFLIDAGADVNAKDKDGGTALSNALSERHIDIARLLIDKGADVNAKNNKSWSVLMDAASWGETDIARLLIEKGADVNAQNDKGWSALIVAALHDERDIAKLLIDKGATINAEDKDGGTALTMAAHKGHMDVARLLIDNGADIRASSRIAPEILEKHEKYVAQFSRDQTAALAAKYPEFYILAICSGSFSGAGKREFVIGILSPDKNLLGPKNVHRIALLRRGSGWSVQDLDKDLEQNLSNSDANSMPWAFSLKGNGFEGDMKCDAEPGIDPTLTVPFGKILLDREKEGLKHFSSVCFPTDDVYNNWDCVIYRPKMERFTLWYQQATAD